MAVTMAQFETLWWLETLPSRSVLVYTNQPCEFPKATSRTIFGGNDTWVTPREQLAITKFAREGC